MSAEEISRLVKALSELGVCKIRLTGGEPTVRKDFFDILKDMKQNFCKIYYLNPASAHSDCIFPVFDRNYFKQVLKVNFPSLAASKNYDLTLLIPFCMF